jgi:F-type H+-transporting ATPase subunit a
MSESGHSATGYIVHHLTNLRFDLNEFCTGKRRAVLALHVDTLFFSIRLGALFLWLFMKAAKSATSGVPGAATEFLRNHGRFCRYSG